MKKKILFSICGEGLGHVKSTVALMRLLEQDHDIKALCWGEPLAYLKKLGVDASETHPDYETSFARESVDLKKTANLKDFIARTRKAITIEDRVISEFKPDLIYSESKISTIIIAQKYRIPCIAVCNQTALHKKLPAGISKLLLVPFVDVSFSFMTRFPVLKKILVRDLPPPFDISEGEVDPKPWGKKLEYIGFMTSWQSPRRKKRRDKTILCGISGTGRGKDLLAVVKKVANESDFKFRILNAGSRHGLKSSRNFKVLPFLDEHNLQKEFENADVYLGLAGFNSISNALVMGVPVITAYPKNHIEQMLNSMNCERKGVGISIGHEPTKERIAYALKRMFATEYYLKNAESYAKLAKDMNGTENAAGIIIKILHEKEGRPSWKKRINRIKKILYKRIRKIRGRLR